MKIKEAIKIVNSTKTAVAGSGKEKIHFYANDGVDKFDYFLMMPTKANNWDDVKEDFEALYSVTPKDLARVMDVIQRLLDTPVNERFPEKEYHLRWIDDQGHCKNYLNLNSNGAWVFVDDEIDADIFVESELEQLKTDNPHLASAIDAMKEEVQEYDRS